MKGLTWGYIEPTPMQSAGLVASNIQASQSGLANSMDNLIKLSNDMQIRQANQQAQQDYLNQVKMVNDLNNARIADTQVNGLANLNIPQNDTVPVQEGNGLARPITNSPSSYTEAIKPYMGTIQQAAKENGVPEEVLLAVIQTESGGNPKAVSPTGVKGLMQVTQNTYKGLGFTGDRADPINSINAGAKLLGQLHKQYGNWDDAFAAYNGGGDAVKGLRSGNWGTWANNLNKQKEISQYIGKVNSYRTVQNS